MGDYITLGGRVAVRDHVSIASKVLNHVLVLRNSELILSLGD